MALTYRLVKGTPLTAGEHDGNLDALKNNFGVLSSFLNFEEIVEGTLLATDSPFIWTPTDTAKTYVIHAMVADSGINNPQMLGVSYQVTYVSPDWYFTWSNEIIESDTQPNILSSLDNTSGQLTISPAGDNDLRYKFIIMSV